MPPKELSKRLNGHNHIALVRKKNPADAPWKQDLPRAASGTCLLLPRACLCRVPRPRESRDPGGSDVGTFTAVIGASLTIKAQPGAWGILATGLVTVA